MLGHFLTPEDLTDLKRTAIKVGVIWGLIEWRTRKRFRTLENVIVEVKAGFAGIKTSFSEIEDSFNTMSETIRELVLTVKRVELSDTDSTKLLSERIERQAVRQTATENTLSDYRNRITIIETKAGMNPQS